MSTWNRRLFSLALLSALTVGLSCTSIEDPLAPAASAAAAPEAPAQFLGPVGTLLSPVGTVVSSAVDLLVCRPQPYAATTGVVGREGGTIVVGQHKLVIPRGALQQNVKITAEQVRGSTNSVRFSPEGLKFKQPAQLTMSYKNCFLVLGSKRIVYTDELLSILNVLVSKDAVKSKTVTSPIDHFSRYAVAY
ncbi:MAG TPA: hypothetical protein VHL81_02500 [Gemmatimonadales bacterium]|jgi:hypothetical protein|nr:hypothetical protein [Gemmatimonadales bacterium]